MSDIGIRIVTPRGLYLEEPIKSIHARSTEGEFTLLPNHIPIVMALVPCKMVLTTTDGEKHDYAISGGFLSFNNNHASLMTDAIEGKEQIDIARAKAAYLRARQRLEKKDTDTNMKRSELALKRALNRLHVTDTQIQ